MLKNRTISTKRDLEKIQRKIASRFEPQTTIPLGLIPYPQDHAKELDQHFCANDTFNDFKPVTQFECLL